MLGDIGTGWLRNNIGVHQGCVISPTLFNIYLELIMRIRMAEKGVTMSSAYADDKVLMAESREDMEELLQVASIYGRELGRVIGNAR